MLTRKTAKSHATRTARRNPVYGIRLKRKAVALLKEQAQGKFLNNTQKRIITRWQQIERQNRHQEVSA